MNAYTSTSSLAVLSPRVGQDQAPAAGLAFGLGPAPAARRVVRASRSRGGPGVLAACVAVAAGLPALVCAQPCPPPPSQERGWTRLDLPVSPPPRFEGGFAGLPPGFIGTAGLLGEAGVLATGRGVPGTGAGPTLDLLGDTWLWRSAAISIEPAWVPSPAALVPRANAGLVSAKDQPSVPYYYVAGGIDVNGPTSQIAILFGGNWVVLQVSLPSPRFNHALASVTSFAGPTQPILVGGTSACAPLLSQTIQLGFQTLANYPSNLGVWVAGAASISDSAFVVPFGDRRTDCATPTIREQVARYDRAANNWVFLDWPIPARANYALASKRITASQYEVVLFGGDLGNYPSSTGLLADTWIINLSGPTFTQVTGPGPSPRRARNQMIYDVSRDWYVLFGGHDGTILSDTWVLSREPVFGVSPAPARSCPTGSATLTTVVGGGGTIQVSWFWRPEGVAAPVQVTEGVNLHPVSLQPAFTASGAATSTLSLVGLGLDSPPGPRVFEAHAQNCVATTISPAATWTICRADFNCDGDLNPDDLGDYITCFFTEPPCPGADFNADSDVNPDDLGDYITTFFQGC